MIVNIKDLQLTEDIYNQIINLYSYFKKIKKINLTFKKLQEIIKNLNDNHYILFYIENNIIKGAITLFIEQKIIHDGGLVGHIEDYIVLEEYRSQGIGKMLLNYVIQLCKQHLCYKCILNCDTKLIEYYKKFKFVKKGVNMSLYF